MAFAFGTNSRSSSSRFASTSVLRTVMPVTLPPGRFRLATNPLATGSKPVKKMIGMDVVAALAATMAVLHRQRSHSLAAEPDRPPARLAGPPDCPLHGIQLPDCGLRHNPSRLSAAGPGRKLRDPASDPNPRTPITLIVACCPCAARGHATAPPNAAINSRLRMVPQLLTCPVHFQTLAGLKLAANTKGMGGRCNARSARRWR